MDRLNIVKVQLQALLEQTKTKEAKNVFGVAIIALTLYNLKKFLSYLKWRRGILTNYPGSKNPSLILGDIQELIATGGFGEEFFIQLHEKHGEFTRFFLGPTMLNFTIANPDYAIELYKKAKSRPFETYMFLSYLGKENLLFTHGPMVKKLRLVYGRMISNPEQLRKVNEVSFREFGLLHKLWGNAPGGVDVFKDLSAVIYDVMGQVLFGGSWTATDVGKQVMTLHLYLVHNVNKWMFWPFPPYFLPEYLEYLNTIRKWRELCWSLIEERRKEIDRNPKAFEKDESALTVIVTAKDENGKPFFSKERAISTMCGFLNGAYDTTHVTLYWMIFNLARFQDVQRKVREDIQSIIGGRTTCEIDELRSMEYLDAFMKESMRYNVTVPVNQRVNYEEDMNIGGWIIPKGTNVNVPMRPTFRHKPSFGQDVDTFRPERFMPEDPFHESARRVLSAFGGSSRMCIGETFAKVELKAFLISMLSQYQVTFRNPENAKDTAFTEAGVNQPVNKELFIFTRLNDPEIRAAENLSWWTPEKVKSRKALSSPSKA